jgi:hypothetical protein
LKRTFCKEGTSEKTLIFSSALGHRLDNISEEANIFKRKEDISKQRYDKIQHRA